MNKVIRISIIIVLTMSAMFSSLMIHIYNTTSVEYNGSVGTPLTTDEIVMYNSCIYILCISTLGLMLYWYYREYNNVI